MALQSQFFRGVPELEAAAVSDPAHILQGSNGDHVGLIQQALIALDAAQILRPELIGKRYGPSTAAAVLRYKQKRHIINRNYQQHADNIVGTMTMAALDKEMAQLERTISADGIRCDFGGRRNGPRPV